MLRSIACLLLVCLTVVSSETIQNNEEKIFQICLKQEKELPKSCAFNSPRTKRLINAPISDMFNALHKTETAQTAKNSEQSNQDTIECSDKDQVINVLSATISNLDKSKCEKLDSTPTEAKSCNDRILSTILASKMCNGLKKCELSVDKVFGVVCKCSVQKFLEITYTCDQNKTLEQSVSERSKRYVRMNYNVPDRYEHGYGDEYDDYGYDDAYDYNYGYDDAGDYNYGYDDAYDYNYGYDDAYDYNYGYDDDYGYDQRDYETDRYDMSRDYEPRGYESEDYEYGPEERSYRGKRYIRMNYNLPGVNDNYGYRKDKSNDQGYSNQKRQRGADRRGRRKNGKKGGDKARSNGEKYSKPDNYKSDKKDGYEAPDRPSRPERQQRTHNLKLKSEVKKESAVQLSTGNKRFRKRFGIRDEERSNRSKRYIRMNYNLPVSYVYGDEGYEDNYKKSGSNKYGKRRGSNKGKNYGMQKKYGKSSKYGQSVGNGVTEGYGKSKGYGKSNKYSKSKGYGMSEGYGKSRSYDKSRGYRKSNKYSKSEGYANSEDYDNKKYNSQKSYKKSRNYGNRADSGYDNQASYGKQENY